MPTDNFPADWRERYSRLLSEAAAEFRDCSSDPLAQLQACARYFNRGQEEGFDHGELIDYLGVSAHSVLELAGYSDEQGLRVMELLPLLEVKDGICNAPLALPAPPPPDIPATQPLLPFNG